MHRTCVHHGSIMQEEKIPRFRLQKPLSIWRREKVGIFRNAFGLTVNEDRPLRRRADGVDVRLELPATAASVRLDPPLTAVRPFLSPLCQGVEEGLERELSRRQCRREGAAESQQLLTGHRFVADLRQVQVRQRLKRIRDGFHWLVVSEAADTHLDLALVASAGLPQLPVDGLRHFLARADVLCLSGEGCDFVAEHDAASSSLPVRGRRAEQHASALTTLQRDERVTRAFPSECVPETHLVYIVVPGVVVGWDSEQAGRVESPRRALGIDVGRLRAGVRGCLIVRCRVCRLRSGRRQTRYVARRLFAVKVVSACVVCVGARVVHVSILSLAVVMTVVVGVAMNGRT